MQMVGVQTRYLAVLLLLLVQYDHDDEKQEYLQ